MHDLPSDIPPSDIPLRPAQSELEWAIETRLAYLRKGTWLPLLVRFRIDALPRIAHRTPLEVFATLKWLGPEIEKRKDIVVPELFDNLPAFLKTANDFSYCILLIKRDRPDDVARVRRVVRSEQWTRVIASAQLGPPIDYFTDSATSDNSPVPTPNEAQKPVRVVVAVIDQGIAFANSRFFNGNQPRIDYLWQQNFLGTILPPSSLTTSATPGFELTKASIKSAVDAGRLVGADEDWVYCNFGGLTYSIDGYKPLGRRHTHGTQVLDLAISNLDPTQHPVIAVDLPEDAVGDPAGATLSVHAAWGLIYAIDRAEKLRLPYERLPVVVNLSYGQHEGPHDGSGDLEQFIEQIYAAASVSPTPLEIVLAAGNFRQTRTRATANLRATRGKVLHWRLQPGSLSPSLMEIWLPPNYYSQFTVELKPPSPTAQLRPLDVGTNQAVDTVLDGFGNALYRGTYVPAGTFPGQNRARVSLAIARTAPDPAGGWASAAVPSGVWHVTIKSSTAVKDIDAWIKRSVTLSGRRAKGRQSHFEDKAYARFMPSGRPYDYDPGGMSDIRRLGTLSGIATGANPRIIGTYRASDFYPSLHSSHGTRITAIAGAQGPNWLECGEESDVLRGILVSGSRTGSVSRINGTSAAAPQATGWIAEEWLATGARPNLPPGLFVPVLRTQRPIPLPERPVAFGNGLAPARLRPPPYR